MLECRLNKDTDLWHTVIFPSVQIWLSIHCFTDNSHQSLPQKSYFFLFWCYINRRGKKRLHVRGQTQESNAKVCAGQVFALVPTSEIIRKYMRCLLGIMHSFAKYIRFTKKTQYYPSYYRELCMRNNTGKMWCMTGVNNYGDKHVSIKKNDSSPIH